MVEGYLENPISSERHPEKNRPRQRLNMDLFTPENNYWSGIDNTADYIRAP